jgi:hypothetical protein
VIPLTDGLPGILKIDFTRCKRHSDVGNNDDKDRKTRFQQPNIDRCLDIDEHNRHTASKAEQRAARSARVRLGPGFLRWGLFVFSVLLRNIAAVEKLRTFRDVERTYRPKANSCGSVV